MQSTNSKKEALPLTPKSKRKGNKQHYYENNNLIKIQSKRLSNWTLLVNHMDTLNAVMIRSWAKYQMFYLKWSSISRRMTQAPMNINRYNNIIINTSNNNNFISMNKKKGLPP